MSRESEDAVHSSILASGKRQVGVLAYNKPAPTSGAGVALPRFQILPVASDSSVRHRTNGDPTRCAPGLARQMHVVFLQSARSRTRTCIPGLKNLWLLRPWDLAWNSARSAFFNNVSASAPSVGYTPMPTLTVMLKS
jgi:hypothetical protein